MDSQELLVQFSVENCSVAGFQVSTVVWESKTEEEKEQVFQKLLRFTVQKPKTVPSSDGLLVQFSVENCSVAGFHT
jgi:hypothetical protein